MLNPTLRSVVSGSVLYITLACLTGTLSAANASNFTYLALGDSVSFGLDPNLLMGPQAPSPFAFVGYPETVAAWTLQSNKLANASCPGETSNSFVSPGGRDLGCHDMGPQGQPPFKTAVGLRVKYDGTQLAYAISQLSSNRHINTVTLSIGANDFLLLARDCGTAKDPNACINAGVPGMAQTYGANLATILGSIRATGYKGTIVLLGYYAPTSDLIPVAQLLNGIMQGMQKPFGTTFADGLKAFTLADGGGDPCKAGLLIHLTPTTCDIHPSPLGRDILALTVLAALVGVH